MINKDNLKDLLTSLKFEEHKNIFSKHFTTGDFYLKVDFNTSKIIYPQALKISGDYTTNFSSAENYVVLECVHRLLEKGYKPQHIELEPKWDLGRGASGGRADVFVRNQEGKPLLIIECKTFGREFVKEWKDMQNDGGQLFSYIEQEKDIDFVCLYASTFDEKTKEINIEHRIISHKDNAKILADDPKLKAFKDAKNVKERYKVWKDTYLLEFTEKGLFEENIQAYQIGKDKYTLEIDTKIVDASDKKGKYHEFRTILRKHNVSRRENAFEVLVNLFLCKIVDEKENKDNLDFYWKGIAYDNYFDLVDRLQNLYKIGMEEFLEQKIMYISDKQINDIFWAFKQKRSAEKQAVKEYFKELKFYKGLDFEFIKVHNKEKFDKNAKILLEIIQMWQGLRLKTKEQNQFLGDMFEFFLDNGIKQSEGQFFTPVPICKFIVMSLPLESQIQGKKEALKAIDYACGSGHFLTEYALQIKPLVKKYKEVEPSEYYRNIYGIEKEDRLAKVAKVSAFMYGLNEIKVIEADALMPNPQIEEAKFDVLVANPPFAVEDFLMTLEEEDRERYDLLGTVSDLGNKNIQCFFLERAKQLLTGGGVAGIVVPSSVLSNSDTMHVQTREILLKFFDFVSIVELGSGTFGKTGTNTVVLFLRRKAQYPEPAVHYWNRVQDFFENWETEYKTFGGQYLDIDVVQRYCQHINVPFEDYQELLAPLSAGEGLGRPTHRVRLMQHELFKDYRNDFDADTEIVNLKKKKTFKDLDAQGQTQELNKRFLKYLQTIEQDKLYYFMLADGQNKKVLLVKSPSDTKEQRQFLGYEWSGAKGNEGIKYNGGDTVYDIITPMFDPKNPQNVEKINYLIQQNYLDNNVVEVQNLHDVEIPENLTSIIQYTNLTDLLDFSRKDFNKGFSLTPKKNNVVESKWELVKLGELAEIQSGGTPSSDIATYWDGDINWATLVDTKDKYLTSTKRKITDEGLKNSSAKLLPINTVIFSSRATIGEVTIAKVETATNQGYKNFICNEKKVKHEFLYEILKYCANDISELAGGMTFKEISKTTIENYKIPLPPLEIQQQIVAECEKVDLAVGEAQKKVIEGKKEIENMVLSNDFKKEKLGQITKKVNDSIDPQSQEGEVNYVGLENIESNSGRLVGNTKTLYLDIKSTKTCFKKGDVLYGKLRPNLNKVYLSTDEGICSTDILVFRFGNENLAKFYAHYFLTQSFNEEVLQGVSGQQLPRTSWGNMQEIKIPVPPLLEQQKLVSAIEQIEKQIADNQLIINQSAAQKQAVMKKYL